ncbi:MAG: SDR family NAD(P)-dependent oxidoreductase [Phycisphaerae bacterium]
MSTSSDSMHAPVAITTVAVTGATGFVGRAIVAELVAKGYSVRALVRDREKARRTLPSLGSAGSPGGAGKVQLIVGDVLDASKVAELLKGAQACINLVGIIRETRHVATGAAVTFRKSHVEATRTLVHACEAAGVRRYVQMSALGVTPNGVSEYQKTKFEGEAIVRMSTLDWTIFRPGLIHGKDGEFVQLMRSILRREQPPYLFAPYFQRGVEDKRVPLGGVTYIDPKVQPVAVEDVAAAFTSCLTNASSVGEVYNLVGSETLDWPAMLSFMRDAMHASGIHPFGIPAEAAAVAATVAGRLGLGDAVPFDAGMARMGAQDATASLDKVRAELHLSPKGFRESFSAYAGSL